MSNIMDYLVWRGELDWNASAFNEVDNVILSELVYVDFSDIVPGIGGESISLAEANERFFAQHTEEEINARVSSTKMADFMMREMDETQREVFVDTLFGILDEADIRTVDDLANMNYTKFMELMKAKSSLDKETQDTMRDTFLKLVQKSAKTVAEHLLNK